VTGTRAGKGNDRLAIFLRSSSTRQRWRRELVGCAGWWKEGILDGLWDRKGCVRSDRGILVEYFIHLIVFIDLWRWEARDGLAG
jgi:hypothetical protein